MSRKWERGDKITDPMKAVIYIVAGEVLFYRHKPQNAGWMQNWSISAIRRMTKQGFLFEAKRVRDTEI